MIVHRLATLLHDVEGLGLAVSGTREVLVDAGGARLGGNRRVIGHGSFLSMFLYLRHSIPRRAVKLIGQPDPVHARVVEPVRLIGDIVSVGQFEKFGVGFIAIGVAESLVIVPHVLRRRQLLVRMQPVVGAVVIVILAAGIERIELAWGQLLPFLHVLELSPSLIDPQLILQSLLLRYLLDYRQVPVIDLGRFTVPVES